MSSQGLQVLVVEDDEDDFLHVRQLLKKSVASARVERAANAAVALEMADEHRHDLCLLDYRLGDKDGLEVLRELKERDVEAPIIFLTGQGDEEVAVQAMKAGATDYLLKSKLNPQSLDAAVRYALTLRAKEEAVLSARRALRASEQRFRALVENSSDAIVLLDAQATIIYASQSLRTQLGYTPLDLAESSVFQHLHPEDEPAVRATFASILQTPGVPFRMEYRCRHRDGDWRLLEAMGTNRLLESAVGAVVINQRDVTARKLAEEEIYRLNRELKALSKCNQALLHASEEGELLRRVCQIVVQVGGYRMAWVAASQNEGQILSLASAGEVQEYQRSLPECAIQDPESDLPVAAALRTGTVAHCPDLAATSACHQRGECGKCGNGSMIALPLQVDSKVVGALAIYATETAAFDAGATELLRELAANVSYGVSALRARAERRAAADKLRKLSSAVEQSADLVVMTDANGVIEYVNPTFEILTGYSRGEAVGKTPRILKSGRQDQAYYQCMWAKLLSGQVFRDVLVNRKKNGELWWTEKTITPVLDDRGQVRHFISNDRDITQRRALEQQLLHSQKLDAVGQLAGGVAHDFNNLLMVISSYAELLSDSVGGNAKALRQAQEILKAARRAAGLTQQLLAFSRKQVLSPRILDLNTVLADMGRMLPRLIGEDIQVVVRPGSPLWKVKADPVQIEQVIMNLAVNARDAMPRGGQLVLETSNEGLDEEYARRHLGVQAGDYVMLTISDTGCGIPADILPHIFEPFFTTKERGKGTGLGLPTVYGIVKQSGGSVWVYSEVDQGTVFKVYLPRADAAVEPRPEEKKATRPPRGSETILMVEDEEAVRESTSEYLTSCGYTVLQGKNGADAQQVLQGFTGEIELVITDVIMPGLSGAELGKWVREQRPETKVIYMSGYTESTVVQHGVEAACGFLQKPFTLAALADKVREILDAQPVPAVGHAG